MSPARSDAESPIIGDWRLCGTTQPFLGDPRKTEVAVSFSVHRSEPLVCRGDVSWKRGDRTYSLPGFDRVSADGVHHWRGRGWRIVLGSLFRFDTATADGTVIVLRYSASLISPAGLHVLARSDLAPQTLRDRILDESSALGLPRTELEALRWRFG